MGILKTAVKVGVATSVHGRVQRRQRNRWAAEDQAVASAPPISSAPPANAMGEQLALLQQLGQLRDAGVLTDAEFEAKKAHILRS